MLFKAVRREPEEKAMRFMMLMLPGPKPEAGVLPDPKIFADMMKYNEELQKAGVLLALDGLHPTSKGARVSFRGGGAPPPPRPLPHAKEGIRGRRRGSDTITKENTAAAPGRLTPNEDSAEIQ